MPLSRTSAAEPVVASATTRRLATTDASSAPAAFLLNDCLVVEGAALKSGAAE